MPKRAKTKPAAKGRRKTKTKRSTPAASRTKTKSWDMRNMEIVGFTPPWCDETFHKEMAEWWDSPDGSLWLDMLSELEEGPLKDVGLDARQRKFLWPDAGALDLEQSTRHINQQRPHFPEDNIKEFLIYWILNGYEPKGYSEAQMDELERLTEQWAEDVNPGKN